MRKPTNSIQAPMTTNLVSTAVTNATERALVGTSSAYAIANGEVALLATDLDFADYGNVTATPDGKTVKLIQGTPKSASIANVDPWGVSDPAIVKTENIYKDGVRSITTTNYNSGAFAISAFTSAPTPVANGDYGMIVILDGVRQQREYGQNTDQPSAQVQTPATLPAQPLDLVLQNLAIKLNTQSQMLGGTKRFVVLGIKVAGGAGTALGGIVNDNSTIDFQSYNGITYNIAATTPLVRGLSNLIAASATIKAASTIEVLGSVTPGSAATVDALIVVGLDADLGAYEDDVYQVRTDVTFNPSDEFESEGTVEKAYGSEGEGSGRALTLDAESRAQIDIHTKQITPYGEYFSKGYTYLDPKKNYGATYVDFIGKESAVDHEYTYEKQAVILWEQTEPTTLGVATDVGITAISAFTPTATKPAVIAQLATWSGVTEVTV